MSDQQPYHDMLDDVALYALGTLPAADAQRVRDHMATCAECRAEYEALAPAAALVGVSAETQGDLKTCPSTLLKPRIMREIRKSAATTGALRAPSRRGRGGRKPRCFSKPGDAIHPSTFPPFVKGGVGGVGRYTSEVAFYGRSRLRGEGPAILRHLPHALDQIAANKRFASRRKTRDRSRFVSYTPRSAS